MEADSNVIWNSVIWNGRFVWDGKALRADAGNLAGAGRLALSAGGGDAGRRNDRAETSSASQIADLMGFTARTLAAAQTQVTALLGIDGPSELPIYYLPGQRYRALSFVSPETTGTFFRGAVYVRRDRSVNAETLELTLRHEYVHAAVAVRSGYRAPAWIDEGLAQHLEGLRLGRRDMGDLRARVEREGISLAALAEFGDWRGADLRFAYHLSLFATEQLLEEQSPADISIFLHELRSSDLNTAFKRSFGLSLSEFERRVETRIIQGGPTEVSPVLVADNAKNLLRVPDARERGSNSARSANPDQATMRGRTTRR